MSRRKPATEQQLVGPRESWSAQLRSWLKPERQQLWAQVQEGTESATIVITVLEREVDGLYTACSVAGGSDQLRQAVISAFIEAHGQGTPDFTSEAKTMLGIRRLMVAYRQPRALPKQEKELAHA